MDTDRLLPKAVITVGDRQFSLPLRLLRPDGTLATLTSCTLRMVNLSDKSVKIAAGAVTIVPFTDQGLACNARYDWGVNDVNTAGTYAIQITDTAPGSVPQRWPTGETYILRIDPVIGT